MIWKNIISKFARQVPRQENMAEFYRGYLSKYNYPDLEKPVNQQEFIVFDTETSGLDPKNDEVLSIGAVRVTNGTFSIADSFSIRIKSNTTLTQKSVAIHGLVGTSRLGAEPSDAVSSFFHYVGSGILVGHHTAFDIAMINNLSVRHGGGPLKNLALDTSLLTRRLDDPHFTNIGPSGDYSLDKLCKRFGIEMKARHTADGDAYLTALVFLKIMHRLQQKGVTTRQFFK